MFLTSFYLGHICSGLAFFIMEIVRVAILDLFIVFFAMGFYLWLSFGCFNYQASQLSYSLRLQPRVSGFFLRLRIVWFGHSKAM